MALKGSLAAVAAGGIDWTRATEGARGLKRATYEDVLAAPENKVAEILGGELFLSPRPAPRHSLASSRLGGGAHALPRRARGPWWLVDPGRA